MPKGERFHVEGQTSAIGPRWQIWDGERHFARFQNIADEASADDLCAELNNLTRPQPTDEAREGVVEAREKAVAGILLTECHMEPSDRWRVAADIVQALSSLSPDKGGMG